MRVAGAHGTRHGALRGGVAAACPQPGGQGGREAVDEAGRFAELVAITKLLQSAERGDQADLVPALRQRAREVRRWMGAG